MSPQRQHLGNGKDEGRRQRRADDGAERVERAPAPPDAVDQFANRVFVEHTLRPDLAIIKGRHHRVIVSGRLPVA